MTNATKTVISPFELREELNNLSAEMRNDPSYDAVAAHIAEHDKVEGNKPLAWVLDAANGEPAPNRARMIRTASKVFHAMVRDLEKVARQQAQVTELNEQRLMILAEDKRLGGVLNSWVKEAVYNDDLSTSQARGQLVRAIPKAQTIHERAERINAKAAAVNAKAEQAEANAKVFTGVLDQTEPWWGYGWDAELETIESRDADRTANQDKPYVPWKVELIDAAFEAKKEGTLVQFLVTNNPMSLARALAVFVRIVEDSGNSFWEERDELRKQFEAILGDKPKTKPVEPAKPFVGKGSKSKASAKKSTKGQGTPESRGEVPWEEKHSSSTFKTGAPNPQGPGVDQTSRGKAVAHAGMGQKEKSAKGLKK